MSDIELLDKICSRIFLYLGLTKEKIGFNDLYRSLDKIGCRISKPTLSEHLKHLTEKKVITRKEIGKQKVSYEINWEHFKHLLEARENGKKMEKSLLLKQGKYKSLSPEEELVLTEYTLTYVSLQQLRLSILADLNPEKKFEYNLELLFISRYFDIYKSLLMYGYRENKEEFGKQILQLIEAKLKDYWHMVPEVH